MEISKLNDTLRKEARGLGLCDAWYNEWKGSDYSQQKLIDKYIEGIDFCIGNRYPSNEFIKKNFDGPLLFKNNIVVCDQYSMLNPFVGVVLGESAVKVRCNGWHVSKIYVRDTSELEVYVRQHAHLIIHAYDEAKVTIMEDTSTNPVKVVLHGEKAQSNAHNVTVVYD